MAIAAGVPLSTTGVPTLAVCGVMHHRDWEDARRGRHIGSEFVELPKVVGTATPFTSTEDVDTKPVPVTPIETAVLIGPALTDSDVSVGTGGYVMVT
jgi:hypothetical protein